MRKTVCSVSLIFILSFSLFSGSAISGFEISSGQGSFGESQPEGWWDNWIRDSNHNNIDDVLDDMIANNPGTHRTRIFADYSQPPTENDISRLSKFDLEIKYVYNIIDTICARNVLLSDIEEISLLPHIVMIEYEEEIYGHLDVGSRAIKARESAEYSPNTVYDMNIFGNGISIAILDSGVDDGPSPAPPPYHDSLDDLDDDSSTDDPKFIAGADVTHSIYIADGSYNPDDGVEGHGTHVAGTAMGTGAGAGDGEYKGVAPQARLVDIKVMDRWGSGVMGEAIRGIEWCVEHKDEFNIRVMSMSIGGNYQSDGQDAGSRAVNAAADEGVISVIAVGNGGSNTIGPPGAADKAITVGALDDKATVTRDDDEWWSSSNIGPRQDDGDTDHIDELKPDILAPGVDIMAPKSDTPSGYIQFDGTSMACPHVAGVVALMLEANPDLTPERVKEILRETAEMPSGIDPSTEYDDKYNYQYGWGMVDAYEAVRLAQQEDDRAPIISDWYEEVSGTSVTINWLTHKKANDIIEYGESPSQLTLEKKDLENYTFNHSMTLRDLEEGTEYFYQIKGYDENDIGPGESPILNFTTAILPDTTPPAISGIEVIGKSDTTATIFWETNEGADSLVEYGLTPAYGFITTDFKFMWKHSITLFGLAPETEYSFRVNSSDASGNYNQSDNRYFVTDASPDVMPPVISNLDIKEITDTTAIVMWRTDEPSNSLVKIGETLSYGKVFSDLDYYWKIFAVKMTGLTPSTKYYFRVESTDPSDNTGTEGDETHYFWTEGPPDNTPPKIISGPDITILTDTSATIEWVTDEESESVVEYGYTDSYGFQEPGPLGEYLLVHNITINDLNPTTTYHFRVRSKDGSPDENEVISDDETFTTKSPPDTKPPIIIDGPNVLVVGEHTATIAWITNEESDSKIRYGTSSDYGDSSFDYQLVRDHIVVLTNLDHSTKYYFKVSSADASQNIVESTGSFTTLEITIPLEIRFINLFNGQTLKGVVTIEGEITGGAGNVESVKYKIDDESWQNLDDERTFNIILDTTQYSKGEHTLYLEAKVGVMTMQESVTFNVDQSSESEEALPMWTLLLLLAVLTIIVLVPVIARSQRRKRDTRALDLMQPISGSEAPFSMGLTPITETQDFGFIPDDEPLPSDGLKLELIPDEEPVSFGETEDGISFIPETTILSEEPGIAFIPDREPISFNIEEDTSPPVFDTVRCPRCKKLFNADLSSAIACPECGFSASIR